MGEDAREARLRWKIDKDIELYSFYLDVSVKASVFLMAVTGAIASYILSKPENPIVALALAFPAVVNAGFAVLFFYSIAQAKRIARVHVETSKALGVPEFNMNPLKSVCEIFCLMCAVATVGLVALMAYVFLHGGWGQFDDRRNTNISWVSSGGTGTTPVGLPCVRMRASDPILSKEPPNLASTRTLHSAASRAVFGPVKRNVRRHWNDPLRALVTASRVGCPVRPCASRP